MGSSEFDAMNILQNKGWKLEEVNNGELYTKWMQMDKTAYKNKYDRWGSEIEYYLLDDDYYPPYKYYTYSNPNGTYAKLKCPKIVISTYNSRVWYMCFLITDSKEAIENAVSIVCTKYELTQNEGDFRTEDYQYGFFPYGSNDLDLFCFFDYYKYEDSVEHDNEVRDAIQILEAFNQEQAERNKLLEEYDDL